MSPLVNLGRDILADSLIGGTTYARFNNAGAHIGAGNGTTAFAQTQTNLMGASTSRRPMEATYPTRTANAITFRSLFGTGDANFTWEEWGIFNAATGGQMLSRKVENLGAKTSAITRQVTTTITVVHT